MLTTLYSFTYPSNSTVTVPNVAYNSLLQTAVKAHYFVLLHMSNATLPQKISVEYQFLYIRGSPSFFTGIPPHKNFNFYVSPIFF